MKLQSFLYRRCSRPRVDKKNLYSTNRAFFYLNKVPPVLVGDRKSQDSKADLMYSIYVLVHFYIQDQLCMRQTRYLTCKRYSQYLLNYFINTRQVGQPLFLLLVVLLSSAFSNIKNRPSIFLAKASNSLLSKIHCVPEVLLAIILHKTKT